jgi:hypothetical protein
MPAGAAERARKLDGKLESQADSIGLPSSHKVLAGLRNYLLTQNERADGRNNVYKGLRSETSGDVVTIWLGPQFDEGPTDSHFYLESNSRLSFGITLREANGRCSLIAYRFHLHLPEGSASSFYRFDLNPRPHDTPLREPRCHLHPGSDDVRLPCPPLSPLDVLDRIFLVIERTLSS